MKTTFLGLVLILINISDSNGSIHGTGFLQLKQKTYQEFEGLPHKLALHQKELNSRLTDRRFRLDRYDLQLGISASGSIGVIGAGVGSAVEFVWQRNLPDGDAGDDIDENDLGSPEPLAIDSSILIDEATDTSEIERIMTHSFQALKQAKDIPRRIRRRIIKAFKKDATKIGRLIKELAYMPQVGDWYIGGFFKNYSFSTGLSVGAVSLGTNLRMRFRFKIRAPRGFQRPDAHLTPAQRYFSRLMGGFNQMADRAERNLNQFRLKRVWAIHSLEKEINFALISVSKNRGIQIEYKNIKAYPAPSFPTDTDFTFGPILSATNHINLGVMSIFDRFPYSDPEGELSLHQVRLKYSGSLETGLQMVGVGTSKTMEFHYKR